MLAELENISYYVQTPGHNKRFPGHNSGGILDDLDYYLLPVASFLENPLYTSAVSMLIFITTHY